MFVILMTLDMKYELVKLGETKVAGFSARTNNSSPDMGAVIGGTWKRLFSEAGYSSIPNKITGKTMGIYTDYENEEKGDYTFMAGCAVIGDVPEGFDVRTLPAGKYAKFVVVGDIKTAMGEFWQELWNMDLDRAYRFDFEEYQNADPDNCEIHVYIGVNEPSKERHRQMNNFGRRRIA